MDSMGGWIGWTDGWNGMEWVDAHLINDNSQNYFPRVAPVNWHSS